MSQSVKPVLVLKNLLPREREGRKIAVHISFGFANPGLEALIPELFANELIRQTRGILLQLTDFFAAVADRRDSTPGASLWLHLPCDDVLHDTHKVAF